MGWLLLGYLALVLFCLWGIWRTARKADDEDDYLEEHGRK